MALVPAGPSGGQGLNIVQGGKACHLCYKMEEEYVHELYAMRG